MPKQGSKILYFSNLIPDRHHTTHGIFVFNRLKELANLNIDFCVLKTNQIISRTNGLSIIKNYNLKDIGLDKDCPINVINYTKIPLFGSFPSTNRILKYFKNNNCSFIHAHFVLSAYPIYKQKRKKGIPYIVTAHGSDIHYFPFLDNKYRTQALKVLNNAEMVIFVSNFLKNEAIRFGYRKTNNVVIPNGIDVLLFNESKQNRSESLTKVVGFVGNLVDVKRAHRLPEIFYRIHSLYSNVRFLIVGDGNLKFQIQKDIKRLGLEPITTMTGRIAPYQVADYMSGMDALVLPSKNEGWPCVVLEAQACGVPVIGSENGGIPDAVGEYGKIVNEGPDFEDRFASAVVEVISCPINRKAIAERAKQFSWSSVVAQEMRIYMQSGLM